MDRGRRAALDGLEAPPGRHRLGQGAQRGGAAGGTGGGGIGFRREIVAGAGDAGDAGLCGLGQGAGQGHAGVGMAAQAELRLHLRLLPPRQGQDAEGGDAEVGGDVPDRQGDAGCGKASQEIGAERVGDAGGIDRRFRPRRRGEGQPEGMGVAFHQLGQGMHQRLPARVAGGEAVRGRLEEAGGRRPVQRVVGGHQVQRHPERRAVGEVTALHPEHRRLPRRQVRRGGAVRQAGRVQGREAAFPQPGMAAPAQRRRQGLGMPGLHRLHHRRGLGRRQGRALALEDRERARVGPHRRGDRDAGHVQAG
ncbi:hypothetical protein ROTAS13_04445 [Roseomonas sp. TAS13]|nr:hypothetical protein ROTAS13_04445 [Roseomonas sp. TAS13]